MYTPKDHLELAHSWEAKQLGTCAPAVVAVLAECPVQRIVDEWEDYLGYSNLEGLEEQLENHGFIPKRLRGNKSRYLHVPTGYTRVIARIQWDNPDDPEGKWGHWAEAQRRTHFVLIEKQGIKVNVFCNGNGWFNNITNKAFFEHYLDTGYITSFLAV